MLCQQCTSAGRLRSALASSSQHVLHVLQGDTQTQLSNLRDEGNKYFGKKDYAKALESYDKALKLIPATHEDKPLLHSNKAACHMMAKKYVNVVGTSFQNCLKIPSGQTAAPSMYISYCRYKEATNECSAALEVSPGYHKALTRRAKAYENMGHYKQALSDVQKANKGPDATPETQACDPFVSTHMDALL